jgi:hypothetical protein
MFNEREKWRKMKWDRIDWRLDEELALKAMTIEHGR